MFGLPSRAGTSSAPASTGSTGQISLVNSASFASRAAANNPQSTGGLFYDRAPPASVANSSDMAIPPPPYGSYDSRKLFEVGLNILQRKK